MSRFKQGKLLPLAALLVAISVNPVSGQETTPGQEAFPNLVGDWAWQECTAVGGGYAPLAFRGGYTSGQIIRFHTPDDPTDFTIFNFWYADGSCQDLVGINEIRPTCEERWRKADGVNGEFLLVAYICSFATYEEYRVSDPRTTAEEFMALGETVGVIGVETRTIDTGFLYTSMLKIPNCKFPDSLSQEGAVYERLISSER